MKSAFVVLALSGLAKAEPEADPQLLLNAAPSAFNVPRFASFAPSVYSQSPLIYNAARPVISATPTVYANPAPAFLPSPLPAVYANPAPALLPARPVVYANPTPAFIPAPTPLFKSNAVLAPVPSVRVNHPHNCASPKGCAVRALIDHGLAKRDADSEPEAEADPQFLGAAPFVGASPYAYSNGLYNNVYGLNGLNHLGYAAGSPYFSGYNPVLPAPALHASAPYLAGAPLAAPAPFVAAAPAPYVAATPLAAPAPIAVQQTVAPAPLPVVRHAVVAAPAPVVHKTVVAAPAPVLHQRVIAAPAPVVHRTVVAAPAPIVAVRKPFVKPVIATRTKKVTYTHLGAHPLVNPATVLETESKLLGHQVY